MVEIYDVNKTDLKSKIIRSVTLMKDKDNPMVKPKYILKRASFVTNGKLLIMIHKRRMHYFDLATGIRLSKNTFDDGLESN